MDPQKTADRAPIVRATRLMLLAALAALFVFFWIVVLRRFNYAYELEWMAGGVLDHVERVRQGKPLYVAPTSDWIPFLYPPLYYWLSALLSRFMTDYLACRALSLACTVATAFFVWVLARQLGASRFWRVVAVGLFFASFSYTSYWYDLERSDSLTIAMLSAGAVVLFRFRGLGGALVAGAIIGGAFFAKQPATTFLGAGALGLVLAGQWRRGLAFGAAGVLVIVTAVVWLNGQTGGWFYYYCVKMPAAHGFDAKLIAMFFVDDTSRAFVFTLATAILGGRLSLHLFRRARKLDDPEGPSPDLVVFTGLLAAGFVSSGSSRLHAGGWPNVLVFWTTFACVAVAVVASRFEEIARKTPLAAPAAALLCATVLFQVGLFAYDPNDHVPGPDQRKYAVVVNDVVKRLEADGGEVLMQGRGHVTSKRHFHLAALADVLRIGDPVPADLASALRSHRFAAYIVDDLDELKLTRLLKKESELFTLTSSEYFISERIDDRNPPCIVGWIARPSWVLRPRKTSLTTLTRDQLNRRQRIEMGIAESRMRVKQSGAAPDLDPLDVETMAADLDRAGVVSSGDD
jgi:hypothetical protein